MTGPAEAGAEYDGQPRMMLGSLEVAEAQPVCRPGRVDPNAAAHAEAVRASWAPLVVFPELSQTGYVLDADEVDVTSGALDPGVDACATTGATAFVGAPVRVDGGRRIAVVAMTLWAPPWPGARSTSAGTRSGTSRPVQDLLSSRSAAGGSVPACARTPASTGT